MAVPLSARQVRHAAQAHRLRASQPRALRRVRERRRRADPHLHPERPRVGRCSAPGFWSGRSSSRTRVSSTTRRAPPTGARPTAWSRACFATRDVATLSRQLEEAQIAFAGSTRCSTCCATRIFRQVTIESRRRTDRACRAARRKFMHDPAPKLRSAAVAGSAHASRAPGISGLTPLPDAAPSRALSREEPTPASDVDLRRPSFHSSTTRPQVAPRFERGRFADIGSS